MTRLQAKIIDPLGQSDCADAIGFDKADYPNCSSVLFDNLGRNPENLAVISPLGQLTYRELCGNASQWGHAFSALGLERGDRIAFFLDDTSAYPAAFFGAVRAGFVPVLLNTQTPVDVLGFYLTDSAAKAAVCDDGFLSEFEEALAAEHLTFPVVITNADAKVVRPNHIMAAAFIGHHNTELAVADTGPDDMAFWMYSSGSTGRPKGIVHLHHDMAYTQLSYGLDVLKLKPNDICFSVPKIFFAYGFGNAFTYPFSVGAAVLLSHGQPDPVKILDFIETYKPSIFYGLPTLYTSLCRSLKNQNRDLSSMRLSLSAAEVLSAEIFERWKQVTGDGPVEGLGSTEMLHIYLSNTSQDQRPGSAGRVVAGYDCVLRDQDGALVKEGEEGVMYVRGHSSTPCYWNRPDKTDDTMRGEWIYTGDRFVEKNGYFYFQGRADDLIKVSGQWVWPLEVERCLNEHPNVHLCAVLAHELEDRRMVLRAVVHLRDGLVGDMDQIVELQGFVKSKLQPFKYPRMVEFVTELPKTGTGKIDRQALKA